MSMSKDGINRLIKAMAQQAIEEEAMIIQHISGPAWKPGSVAINTEEYTVSEQAKVLKAAMTVNKFIERMVSQ